MLKRFLSSINLFILFFALFSLGLFNFANAQQSSEVVEGKKVPLAIEIKNISYSVEQRIVSIDYIVTNKSGSFVDDLRYSFEFYNGDKLEKDGLLFRNLDYIISTTDDFGRLAPNETKRQTLQYTPPRIIPGGNYFIRATIFNEGLTNYGVTYTKEPIQITGLGGFISDINAGIVNPENGEVYQLMQGETLEKDQTYIIALPKSINEELFSYLEEKEIYVDLKITHINDPQTIVNQKARTPLSSLIRPDGKGIEIKVEPWADMASGSHTVFLSFVDEKGEQVSESILARFLYRGLIGRIYDVDTNINSYRRGEPLDLLVNVILAGDPQAKKAFLNATVKGTEGEIQEFKREIELSGSFKGDDVYLEFTSDSVRKKMIVEEIDIVLTDENGKVLDEYKVTMDPNQIFGYPLSTKWIKGVILSLIILILIIVGLAFVKKKVNLNFLSLIVSLAIISSSVVLTTNDIVFAQGAPGCTDSTAINYDPSASEDDGSCYYTPTSVPGCMDFNAANYNPTATEDDGSCYYTPTSVPGCMDSNASNYNAAATEDDGSCYYDPESISGCMDSNAINYNSSATIDDGSCEYASCNDPNATNYEPSATNNLACEYSSGPITGCTDSTATNYNSNATLDDGSCYNTPTENPGCTDSSATNYDQTATVNDGSCLYANQYCEDVNASNYGELLPCTYPSGMCEDSAATNYGYELPCTYSSETCQDPEATNYGMEIPCQYSSGICEDTSATNYGYELPCNYDISVEGCTDPAATNYDPAATVDDGSCQYGNSDLCGDFDLQFLPEELRIKEGESKDTFFLGNGAFLPNNKWRVDWQSTHPALVLNRQFYDYQQPTENIAVTANVSCGQIDFSGSRFTYESIGFNASCQDDQGGATFNGNLPVRIERGSCSFNRLSGDLLEIWSVPDEEPAGDQGLCTEDCIDTEFYVKLQCKQCGNEALDLEINYFNKWIGGDQQPTGVHDRTYTVNTVDQDFLNSFSYYTVSLDEELQKQSSNLALSEKIKGAPMGSLVGVPVMANDIINQWIYGPFNFQFCFEYKDDQGNIIPDENNDGMYEQMYNVQAATEFGGDYCQLSFTPGSIEAQQVSNYGGFRGVTNETRDMSCDLPGELRGNFFLDSNEDGVRTGDEPYIKSSTASADCLGIQASPLGRIFSLNLNPDVDYTSLSPAQCAEYLKPYFFKDELEPGQYVAGLDPAGAFGWIQTTIEGFVDVLSQNVTSVDIGLSLENDVAFSCSADPIYSLDFPLDVDWGINNFYSDVYDISDLTFVWIGQTGTNANTIIAGGNNNGTLQTTYNQSTGGVGEYEVSVYARNSNGQIVSNTASCIVGAGTGDNNWLGDSDISCAAYPTISSNVPQLFFGPSEYVYWKSTVDGGTNPYTYLWGGDAAGANRNSGPYRVVSGNPSSGQYSFDEQEFYTATLRVTDDNGSIANAQCTIAMKQCVTDLDCENLGFVGYQCSQSTFRCVVPPPVFLTPLALDPGIVNEGEQCGLSWVVDSADSCIVYKNGEVYDANAGTTGDVNVDPGTYTISCENAQTGETITGGPVRCLVNPEIRES